MGSVQSCSREGQNNRASNTIGETQSRPALEQITGIRNLPAEVLEKIALKLPGKDYAALRQAFKRARQSLPSVKAMNECINQGLCGERAGPYKEIVNAAKSDYIEKVARGAILDALETVKVGKFCYVRNDNERYIALLCRYPHQRPGKRAVLNVLDSFCALVPDKPFIRHAHVAHALLYSVIFLTCDDLASIKQLFSSANQAFNRCKGGEKLVLASLISALKLHLCRHFAEADINNLAALYPDVFSMGGIVHNRYAPEVNDVSWTETLFPFRATV